MWPVLVLVASIGQAQDPEMVCRYSVREPAQRTTRPVQDGFTVTVRRKADPELTSNACVVEITDPAGRVVFVREGYHASVHADTGRDIDNDGHPDVIVGHDSGGGNRCCSEYAIVSLRPAPHLAGTFSNPSFEIDANGRAVVWSTLAFTDLAPDMAQTPTIAMAEQYRDGRFVDVTSEYCPAILAGTGRGLANLSDDLWQLEGSRRAASRAETGPPSFEAETTRVSATTVVLQMTYCGRGADARELIRQVWPDGQHEKIGAAIEAAVAAVRRR